MAGKKQASKKDGKSRIVQGAIDCYIKHGVATTTLKQIADSAGVDQPLIHYYFDSPDELYAEVIKAVMATLAIESLDPLSTERDPLHQILRYLRGTLEWGMKNPGLYSIWIYFYYLSTYSPEFSKLSATIRQTARDRTELFLHRGIEQGLFQLRPPLTVKETAVGIHTLLTGALVLGGTGGGSKAGTAREWEATMGATISGVLSWLAVEKPI